MVSNRMADFVSAEEQGLQGVVNTLRYTVYEDVRDYFKRVQGSEPRKGDWGKVYRARNNATGQEVAIKVLDPSDAALRRMREGGFTPFEAIAKEGGLDASSYLVPRSFQVDEDNLPFIEMPFYRNGDFAVCINEYEGNRKSYGKKLYELDKETVLRYLTDIANGISDFQESRKSAHSDIKPDNFMIADDGRLLLNDFGASTCVSLNWMKNRRGEIGWVYTRAPEASHEDYDGRHFSTDSFGWSSIAYRLFTGVYPLEEEIDRGEKPWEWDAEKFDQIVQSKVKGNKKIPRFLRKFISRNLKYDPLERDKGIKLKDNLEKIITENSSLGKLKKYGKNLSYIGIAAGIVGLLFYKAGTYEPDKLNMPDSNLVLYSSGDDNLVRFDSENIDIKKVPETVEDYDRKAKHAAKELGDNRAIAYLVKTHLQALENTGHSPNTVTEHQLQVYQTAIAISPGKIPTYPRYEIFASALSIEDALTQSKNDGKVDTEDVMAISRLGSSVVSEAKRVSGSLDWEDYSIARYGQGDNKGQFIIPEKEQEFINIWLGYFHSDR